MSKFLSVKNRVDNSIFCQKIIDSFEEMRTHFEEKNGVKRTRRPEKLDVCTGEVIRSMEVLSKGIRRMIEVTLRLADQAFLLSLKEIIPTRGIGSEVHRQKVGVLTHHIKHLSEHADQVTRETQKVAAGIEKKVGELVFELKKAGEGGFFEVDQVNTISSLLKDIHFGVIYLSKDFNAMVEKTICTATIAEEVFQTLKEITPQTVFQMK